MAARVIPIGSLCLLALLGACRGEAREVDQRRGFEAASAAELTPPQRRAIAKLLADGRLAPLPDSARAIRFGGWAGFFTGASYLTFEAPAEDLRRFVEGSPALQGVPGERFGPDGPAPAGSERPDPDFPWSAPAPGGAGRRYLVPLDARGHNSGQVVVDELRGVVHARIDWS